VLRYTDLRVHDRLGGELSVPHWPTPGAGGTLSDMLLWTDGEPGIVENVVTVSLSAPATIAGFAAVRSRTHRVGDGPQQFTSAVAGVFAARAEEICSGVTRRARCA
jgi:hypothetical protein